MHETQYGGVQRLAGQGRGDLGDVFCQRRAPTVNGVCEQRRLALLAQVHANLMGSAGFEPALDERGSPLGQALEHADVRDRDFAFTDARREAQP